MRNKILFGLLIGVVLAIGFSVVFLGSKATENKNQQTVQPETSETPMQPTEPFKKPIEDLTSADPLVFENSLSKELLSKIGRDNLARNLQAQKEIFGGVQNLDFVGQPQKNPDGTVTVEVVVKFEKAERPIISQVTLIKEEGVWKILSTDLLSP